MGCGGTILKHKKAGDAIHWLIVTAMFENEGFSKKRVRQRKKEIAKVSQAYGFKSIHELDFPTSQLDQVPLKDIIAKVGDVFHKIKPEWVYVPNRSDSHSDHYYVFKAVLSCCKWFRFGSIKKVLMYETISETEFSPSLTENVFVPNSFSDISPYLKKKLEILKIYRSEIGAVPFPRSIVNVKSLSAFRGAMSGCAFAESFYIIKETL